MSSGGISVQETSGRAASSMRSALRSGLELLSQNQALTLYKYIRCVLPFDGFVFWVRQDLLNPGSGYNFGVLNSFGYNQRQKVMTPTPIQTAPGSLHVSMDNQQNPDESFSLNHVLFTSEVAINDLDDLPPNTMYIGQYEEFKFAFNKRRNFYKQAGLSHYEGDMVYPVMASQIIDDPSQLDLQNIVVSNSLPVWLYLNGIMPVYPSFLVPDNTEPAYAAVHIGEDDTRAMQAAPYSDRLGNHYQLMADKVRVTMYGLRNFSALDYVDYVLQYCKDWGVIGLMNSPAVRDVKRTQSELSIIAMKKVVDFEVSYHQTRVRDVAQQLITQAFIPPGNFSTRPLAQPPTF